MSETVLDELVIRLGLDTSPLQKDAQQALTVLDTLAQKTQTATTQSRKASHQAASSLRHMRKEAIGLLGVLAGGRGLSNLLKQLSQTNQKANAPTSLRQGGNAKRPHSSSFSTGLNRFSEAPQALRGPLPSHMAEPKASPLLPRQQQHTPPPVFIPQPRSSSPWPASLAGQSVTRPQRLLRHPSRAVSSSSTDGTTPHRSVSPRYFLHTTTHLTQNIFHSALQKRDISQKSDIRDTASASSQGADASYRRGESSISPDTSFTSGARAPLFPSHPLQHLATRNTLVTFPSSRDTRSRSKALNSTQSYLALAEHSPILGTQKPALQRKFFYFQSRFSAPNTPRLHVTPIASNPPPPRSTSPSRGDHYPALKTHVSASRPLHALSFMQEQRRSFPTKQHFSSSVFTSSRAPAASTARRTFSPPFPSAPQVRNSGKDPVFFSDTLKALQPFLPNSPMLRAASVPAAPVYGAQAPVQNTTHIGPVTISVPSGNPQDIAHVLRGLGGGDSHTLSSLATHGAV
ncbi:hypothetical protein AD944_09460 [Acetobacter tropicalis]|nr:hypothetical protein AD944_09460 [Acetobacter tropicalis]